MSGSLASSRIVSMDHFRGLMVLGMLIVNFAGARGVWQTVFGHGLTRFTWADAIMPGFLFAVGFSFRLTALRRFPQLGPAAATRGYLRRSLTLIGLSLGLFLTASAFGGKWPLWTAEGVSQWLFGLLKADLWEVLSFIGVCQLLLLPVILRRPRIRLLTAAALLIAWTAINHLGVFAFQEGQDSPLNHWFGATHRRSWDGGLFGALAWSVPMLAGTLVHDFLTTTTSAAAARRVPRLLATGAAMMLAGYAASCLSTLYAPPASPADDGWRHSRVAPDPVMPLRPRWSNPGWHPAPIPLLPATPHSPAPQLNFWMMAKRQVTPPFLLFATGLVIALYAACIAACDHHSFRSALLTTLGRQALAAYLLHQFLLLALSFAVPAPDPPGLQPLLFAGYALSTCAGLALMEKYRLQLRL